MNTATSIVRPAKMRATKDQQESGLPLRSVLAKCILVAFAISFTSLDALYASDRPWPEDEFHEIQFNILSSRHSTNIQNHVELFDEHRLMYQPLCPPGLNTFTQEGFYAETTFESGKFPAAFVSSLETQTVNGVTFYPLLVYDDGSTNRYYFTETTQSLGYVDHANTYNDEQQSYEPTNIVVTYTLMNEENLVRHCWDDPWLENGESSGPQPTDHLCIIQISKQGNDVELLIDYPDAAGISPTNIDVFSVANVTNVPNFVWTLEATVPVVTNNLLWTDVAPSGSHRLYACGNNDTDDDGDGLADARELLIHLTDRSEADTDGDNYFDGLEVAANTDPKDANSFPDKYIVSGGWEHTVALKKGDGTVWSWGSSEEGQLGEGHKVDLWFPVQVHTENDITDVAAGGYHSTVVDENDLSWGWGRNYRGQLGDDSTNQTSVPVQTTNLVNVALIGGGKEHTLVVKDDGTVWGWGRNADGQLGNNSTNDTVLRVPVTDLTNIVFIAQENVGNHSMAIEDDGSIWVWGDGLYGKLGVDSELDQLVPQEVTTLTNGVAVSAGENHSLFLLESGQVWASGDNDYGQLGDGTDTERHVPVQVSGLSNVIQIAAGQNFSAALRGNGTVWTWGRNNEGQLGNGTAVNESSSPVQVLSLTNVVSIGAGRRHAVAAEADGSVWAWGDNEQGQLGDGSNADALSPVPVMFISLEPQAALPQLESAGGTYMYSQIVTVTCATAGATIRYTSDGSKPTSSDTAVSGSAVTLDKTTRLRVRAFKEGLAPSFTASGLYTIGPQISAAGYHTLAMDTNGTVLAWGRNNQGQLGDGTLFERSIPVFVSGLSNVTEIVAGGFSSAEHSIAITTGRTVWAWGNDGSGQIGDGVTGGGHELLPLMVTNQMKAIGAGRRHSFSIGTNSVVWAWGENDIGQLGLGYESDDEPSPTEIAMFSGITRVAGGYRHSLAVQTGGVSWAWGYNWYNQLGNDDVFYVDQNSPVRVSGIPDVVAVDGGEFHSIALRGDGTVWSFGYNSHGQLGAGPNFGLYGYATVPTQVLGLSNVVAIAAGQKFNIALEQDGTVWSWGYNADGQLGNGQIVNEDAPVKVRLPYPVDDISAGISHGAALKNFLGLTVYWSWGGNSDGQLGVGQSGSKYKPVLVSSPITKIDSDSDGMADWWEFVNFGDLSRDGTLDDDSDGGPDDLRDLDEYLNGTNPNKTDTDDDGIPDGWEVMCGSDPLEYSVSPVSLPFEEQFPLLSYDLGFLHGQNCWGSDPRSSALVLDDQLVGVNDGFMGIFLSTQSYEQLWFDADLVLPRESQPSAPSRNRPFNLFYVATDGIIKGFNANQWVATTYELPVAEWHTFTVEMDYSNEVWSLAVDNSYVINDFGFPEGAPNDNFIVCQLPSPDSITFASRVAVLTNVPVRLDQTDGDSDDMPDSWEDLYGLDTGQDDSSADPDGDGLTNLEEYTAGTDPTHYDTDGDGLSDAWEISNGWDPRHADYRTELPYVEDFESFKTNITIGGQRHWTVRPMEPGNGSNDLASVQPGVYLSSGQALEIRPFFYKPATVSRVVRTIPEELIWVEFHSILKPGVTFDVSGLAVIEVETNLVLRAWNGAISSWTNISPVQADDANWDRVAASLNFSNSTWNLYVTNTLKAADLGFAYSPRPEFGYFAIEGSLTNVVYVDDITIDTREPGSMDLDGDGLDRSTEDSYGTYSQQVDSDADGLVDGTNGFVSTSSYPAGVDVDEDDFVDGEQDYVTSPVKWDTDDDQMPDGWEVANSLDPTNAVDSTEDPDNDQLDNLREYQAGTDPNDSDTDDDTLPDGWEVDNGLDPLDKLDGVLDADGDGLSNSNEWIHSGNALQADTDGDGLLDGWEFDNGLSVTTDNSATDSEPDNLPDWWEIFHFGDTTSWIDTDDPDTDLSNNLNEYNNGTDPNEPDSDGDGVDDNNDTNPLTPDNASNSSGPSIQINWRNETGQ